VIPVIAAGSVVGWAVSSIANCRFTVVTKNTSLLCSCLEACYDAACSMLCVLSCFNSKLYLFIVCLLCCCIDNWQYYIHPKLNYYIQKNKSGFRCNISRHVRELLFCFAMRIWKILKNRDKNENVQFCHCCRSLLHQPLSHDALKCSTCFFWYHIFSQWKIFMNHCI
jgi:hypothetical protein